MKAILKNYRQSPRKVRLVIDVVRGKSVPNALHALQFVEKRAAQPVAKVLKSALANAMNAGVDTSKLVVKHVAVDKGEVLKRFMPRARGSASRINKRSSHITVTLGTK
jgi:large subunit ribosomal protein L22